MTIRNRELNQRLSNLQDCASNAPDGTYQRAKDAASVINDCAESIIDIFKSAGFKINCNDNLRDIEAALYGLMVDSNPAEYGLLTGEGFGMAMNSPARKRVLAQTERDRDQLTALLSK